MTGWFIASPWEATFGVIPTYWPVCAFWAATAGQSPWPATLAGPAHLLLATAALLRRARAQVLREGTL